MPNGITFDGQHSYTAFGLWLSERPDLGSPLPKLNLVDVPGMDGYLDLTEANSGTVRYENRIMKFMFVAMVDVEHQETFKATIMNALHGKMIDRIILDEAPGWYWTGRAEVEFEQIEDWKLRVSIMVDAYPFATRLTDKTVDLTVQLTDTFVHVAIEDVTKAYAQKTRSYTDLRLGTKEFPRGLGEPGINGYEITFYPPEQNDTYQGQRYFQIEDADGNSYTQNISTSELPFGKVIVDDTLFGASGVDATRVYRIYVWRLWPCDLTIAYNAYWADFVNEGGRAVIPIYRFSAVDSNDQPISTEVFAKLIVNGVEYTVSNLNNYSEDIVIPAGANHVVLVPDTGYTVSEFTLEFTEERL